MAIFGPGCLFHFDGADGSSTFTDSSQNGHVLTQNGDAVFIDTAQSKFGGSSLVIGSSADSYELDGSADFAFGTGDFTIDFWLRITSTTGTRIFYDSRPTTSTTGGYPCIRHVSGTGLQYLAGTTVAITGSSLSSNTWYHIAVTRASGSTKLFLNGVQQGSTYSDSNDYTVGTSRPNCSSISGWIEELRVVKGTAEWTSDFTAPTGPWPDGDVPSNVTLSCDGGSYALSGSAAAFATKLSAAAGAYTLSGTAANLRRTLTAAGGSYTYTGSAASLTAPTILTAAAGSYTLSGTAATAGVPLPNQWLTFQNSDATDYGTNATNGTLTGSPTFNTGINPPSVQLNGTSQYVSGTNHPTLGQVTNITICAWVYIYGDSGTFLHVGDPAGTGFALGYGTGDFDTLGNELVGAIDGVAWMPFGSTIGGGFRHVALTRDSSTWRGYVDGVLSSTTYTGGGYNPSGSGNGWSIGRQSTFDPRLFYGEVRDARFYARRLSDANIAALYAAGPQGAPSNVTFTASSGSYTYTGTAANLRRTLGASAGSYTLTGSAASFNAPVTLAAAAGSYTYTGSAASLTATANLTFPAASGSYALTGSAAAFQVGGSTVLATDPGSYTLTGSAASFNVGGNVILSAAAGSYTFTGSATGYARTLAAGAGSYTITGSAATIGQTGATVLTAGPGSYNLTGFPATLPGGARPLGGGGWADYGRATRRQTRGVRQAKQRLEALEAKLTKVVAKAEPPPTRSPELDQPPRLEPAFLAQWSGLQNKIIAARAAYQRALEMQRTLQAQQLAQRQIAQMIEDEKDEEEAIGLLLLH